MKKGTSIKVVLLLTALLIPGVASAQDSLRILTWNIQMLPRFVNSNGKGKRAKAIVDQLKLHRYDVVVFQEAFKKRSQRIIRKGLRESYPHYTRVLNKKAISFKSNGGVIIYSRHPITATAEIRYTARTGFDKLARKGALLAEIDFHGKSIQVIGTHLQAFGRDSILYSQYNQLSEELVMKHAKNGVPQFLCGDFNTRKSHARFPFMLKILQAEDGDLKGDQQYTMDRPYNDLCEGNKEARILFDYIFVRPQGTSPAITRQVKIIRQRWDAEHQDLSDHFAVEAVIGGLR